MNKYNLFITYCLSLFLVARTHWHIDMILLGDLNYDYVANESLHTNPVHYIEALYEMSQLITEKTRVTQSTESTLDIILTTNPGLHKRSGVIKKTLSDHYMTFTELSLPKKTSQDLHNTVTFQNYGHFDESEFVNDIQSNDLLNWRHGEIWEDWKNAFLSLSNKHAPIKTARLKVGSNPWMTSDIVKLMYKRDKIHELAVKRKDYSLMNEYRKLRNTVTDMIKDRKREYFTDVSNSSRTNPRSFWAELGSIIPKINIKSIPRNMSVEEFNIYLKNVPDLISSSFTGDSSLLWKEQESIYTFKFNDVQCIDLMTLLISLSDKTGTDILGFDRKLVRIAGEHIVDSLLCTINDSLSNGTFPDDWKNARVTPVYKNNGDINIMSNYRPISVIGHIAKMVEQLVRSQLVSYLEEHAFISTDQSAYLKGHSTQTSLHRVIDDWLENINNNQTTGVCLLDISKCFDTISHRILLQKLSMYGIKHTEFKWFSSYLDKRKQAVFCHNKLSSLVDITTGVPQGSVLGPFLFLLFINDISNFTTDGCVTNLFADDAMIYASGDSVSEVQRKLQSCLSNISSWYRENRQKINSDKS